EPLLSIGDALGKCSQVGQASGQPGTEFHGEKAIQAEAFIELLAGDGLDTPPETVNRPTIVAQMIINASAQPESRHDLHGKVRAVFRDDEGALQGSESAARSAHHDE